MRTSGPGRRHCGESGFTAIELLISVALLAVIALIISTAYEAGLKAVGTGGAGDRLAGSHDQMTLEQQLGQDVARAACIKVPGSAGYGSCSFGFSNSRMCPATVVVGPITTSTVLCIGWPRIADLSCHVAVYTQSNDRTVDRFENIISPAGVVSAYAGAWKGTTDGVSPAPVPTVSLVSPSPSGYPWVGGISATITSTGVVLNAPGGTFALRPLAVDPRSSTSAIGPSGPPC